MTRLHPDWLRPDWQLPGIGAAMTTRAGGVGQGSFASLNLRDGLGDDPAVVRTNQALFEEAIGARPVWLHQVHGRRVVGLTAEGGATDPASGSAVAPADEMPSADASVTSVPGIACAVQVADCLPVLFAAPGARAVGAAHAGWRGLAAGILEATLAAVCEAGQCRPEEVHAWLGASIGPRSFEVGPDVLDAFGEAPPAPALEAALGSSTSPFSGGAGGAERRRFRPHAPGKWLADLPLLARDRLRAAGVRQVSGGDWCTVREDSRFFSFRRDRVTGRMAAAIWIEPRA